MSHCALGILLARLFAKLNAANAVPQPDEVWQELGQQINQLLEQDAIADKFFTNLGNNIQLPKALEAARILQQLRQRFNADGRANPLVGRIRAAVIEKNRPAQNVSRSTIQGVANHIARLAPSSFENFSRFQVEGWQRVFDTINNREGIVVVAPTGSGKTEVFLMPVIYAIAQSIRHNPSHPDRFVLLYPRVALLKDQLARIFRYIYYAEQAHISSGQLSLFGSNSVDRGIIVGFQFGGIFSDTQDTLDNRDIFEEDGTFKIIDRCPICSQGKLKAEGDRRRNRSRNLPSGVTLLSCDNFLCSAEFRTSISKKDHAVTRPHILVTTAESLDRLYLNPKADFENYLQQLTGIVFDEVHLYYSIYGVHIHHLVRRLEELQDGRRLTRIASSATISDPSRFAAKFFYSNENHHVLVHDASNYEQESAGLEIIYFLQSPEGRTFSGAAPTLIQSVMAMGHGILGNDDRAIVFSDSLDMAGRLTAQIRDAEENKRLWEFRIISNLIRFQNLTCSRTSPSECPIYLAGECWRGILANQSCFYTNTNLREIPLVVVSVSSKQKNDFRDGDIVVATPTLEVGVDDPRIKSTIHYLPPRTVFSFIQKRGRAGRAAGEIAYTLMVLDTTPASQFYFFRRNRLINGSYELPLNPQNEVVQEMHDILQRERQQMVQYFNIAGNNTIQGIWRWIWEKLNGCYILRRYYPQQLTDLNIYPRQPQEQTNVRRILRDWIHREKELLGNYLSLERLLDEIREESPTELNNTVQYVINAVNDFLFNQNVDINNVRQCFRRLHHELGDIYYRDDANQEIIEQISTIENKAQQTWLALSRQQAWGIEARHAECLYDFFRTLERLYEPRTLNMAPDVLKIVLQAMFYLYLGLDETDEPEYYQSCIEYYIPDAYFLAVKPIVIEVRYRAKTVQQSPPKLIQESLTELSTTFIPYKPVYRYHTDRDLSVLDIEHHPDWVSDDRQTVTVTVRLRAEGVTREGILFPKKVYVKPLRSDDKGQQIVKFCPRCYAIHGFDRNHCTCNEMLYNVKLYAEPIVQRSYQASVEPRPITVSFRIVEQMRGTTTVRGSSVEARRVFLEPQRDNYIPLKGDANRFRFDALYDTPIQYGIPTKGIIWSLAEILNTILQDDNLRQRVERVVVEGQHKELNEDLVLHTASHLLHRAIADISGVNEQELEYWTDINHREVIVWERYEGGAGISEVFENRLRTNPEEVYEDLLSSVLCPVDLAENQNWTSAEELRAALTQNWNLPTNSQFLDRVVEEAQAERHVQIQQQEQDEEERMVCREHDGCPACIHTTYCTERNEQVLKVSRLVGEAILRCFVQRNL